MIILQHYSNDKHDICFLVVEKKQTCKLRLDLGLKRQKSASSQIMLKCTHPSKASFPFFYNGFSLFWKFSTPLISSPTEVLPSVYNFSGPPHLPLLFSGVIGKKVKDHGEGRGVQCHLRRLLMQKKFNNLYEFFLPPFFLCPPRKTS